MPRCIALRTLSQGLEIPVADGGADVCRAIVERNGDDGVTWVHSYVSEDKRSTFCVYDAPTLEAIRKTAARNQLPVDPDHPSARPRPVFLFVSRWP
jgi:Nickel responsive protein SCO4226-like